MRCVLSRHIVVDRKLPIFKTLAKIVIVVKENEELDILIVAIGLEVVDDLHGRQLHVQYIFRLHDPSLLSDEALVVVQ